MIVDAFAVTGGYQVRPVRLGFDELRAAMDKNGVDLAMTMSLRAIQTDPELGNEYICDAAEHDPRILPVAVIDPHDHLNVERIIGRAVARGAVALAFHMGALPCPPGSILFRRALKHAAAAGKPLIFVCDAEGELTRIAEMTADLGCAKVLLAGASYQRLGTLMALLEEFDHIYVESSWQASPGSIDLLAGAGGAERILFGSMAPVRPMRPALNMVADAQLTDAHKADVLARNALRFVGRHDQAARLADDVPDVMGMPQVPAIDVHAHFRIAPWLPTTVPDAPEMETELARFNIEAAVVSSTCAYKDDMNVGNREMLEKIGAHKRMLGSVAVNVHHFEDSVKWLDVAARDPRIVHVTIDPELTLERYSSPSWMKLFAEIAARELAVFYNTGGIDVQRHSALTTDGHNLYWLRGAPPDEVEMLRRVGETFPGMPFILGHGHGPEGLELARTCDSFYLDLCSSYPEQNVYRRAIGEVGVDRIVFGSDLACFSPAFVLGSVWEADLTEEEHRKVMRENACRILKLPSGA